MTIILVTVVTMAVSFPIVSVTNYHKISDLTQIYNLIILEVTSLKWVSLG